MIRSLCCDEIAKDLCDHGESCECARGRREGGCVEIDLCDRPYEYAYSPINGAKIVSFETGDVLEVCPYCGELLSEVLM